MSGTENAPREPVERARDESEKRTVLAGGDQPADETSTKGPIVVEVVGGLLIGFVIASAVFGWHPFDSTVSGDGLVIAGVNGTILAIVIAALTGYLLTVFQSIDRMTTELVERYSRTRSSRFYLRVGTESVNATLAKMRVQSGKELEALAILFWRLVSSRAGPMPEPNPPEVTVWEIGTALDACPALMPPAYDSKVTLAEIRRWLADVSEPLDMISTSMTGPTRAGFDRCVAEAVEPFPVSAEVIAQSFGDWMLGYANAVKEMRVEDGAIRRYTARLPSPTTARALAVAVVAAFACGVILPLLAPTVPRVVDALVPCVVYGGALIAVLVSVFGRYKAASEV